MICTSLLTPPPFAMIFSRSEPSLDGAVEGVIGFFFSPGGICTPLFLCNAPFAIGEGSLAAASASYSSSKIVLIGSLLLLRLPLQLSIGSPFLFSGGYPISAGAGLFPQSLSLKLSFVPMYGVSLLLGVSLPSVDRGVPGTSSPPDVLPEFFFPNLLVSKKNR